jgi:hypothetical protein
MTHLAICRQSIEQSDVLHVLQEGPRVRWTCPMHPEVVRDVPGNCPKCGMKLEPGNGPVPALSWHLISQC